MRKQINVVGAIIVRDGEVLCAKRGPRGSLAGRWEFPGGKVEPGETAAEALAREISEELDCTIEVGAALTTTTHDYDFGVVTLTTFWCELAEGHPRLTEHTELRWCDPEELEDLDWAPADVEAMRMVVTGTRARQLWPKQLE